MMMRMSDVFCDGRNIRWECKNDHKNNVSCSDLRAYPPIVMDTMANEMEPQAKYMEYRVKCTSRLNIFSPQTPDTWITLDRC